MKQTLRRIFPWLLALALLCPAVLDLSITARAADDLTVTIDTGAAVTLTDANGDDYYDIGTADELYAFAALVNGGNTAINGKLTKNITVNEKVLTEDGELNGDGSGFRVWTPIGRIDTAYRGTFDGQNHTVSGLYFHVTDAEKVGLFGYVHEGTLQNVGVTDSCFVGSNDIGGIVGASIGTITNCHSAAMISGVNYVGGIAGNNSGTVTNCHNAGKISGSNYVGGIAGYNPRTLTNCYNTGAVTGNEEVGGVAGYAPGIVTNCYNTGDIDGETQVGGVAGYNPGTVTNCYNTGAVTGETQVGGVAGYSTEVLTNCYSTGTVTGNEKVGGIVGYNAGTVANSYFDSTKYSGDAFGMGRATDDLTGGKTPEAFASGEVAYLLSQGSTVLVEVDFSFETGPVIEEIFFSGDSWGQNIGTDDLPNFTGDKVYTFTNCVDAVVYSNTRKEDGSHSFGEDNVCSCGAVAMAWVITKDLNEGYETLEQAIDAVADCTAEDQARVVLTGNLKLESPLSIGSGVFTLDLSGNTLSCDEYTPLEIAGSDTHVTLTDGTVAGGNGVYCVYVNGSAFTLSGGTLRANSENGHGIHAASGSTVNITGGEILAEEFFGGNALEAEGATVNISGGTLRGGQSGLSMHNSSVTVSGSPEISGGYLSGIYASGSNCYVEIHGGKIDSDYFGLSLYEDATATVIGGSFSGTLGILANSGNATVSGGTVTASEADIQCDSGTVSLTVGETGEGATFPGGIWVNGISLNEALGEGAAYWQDGRQIALTEDLYEITDGDVTVKTACGHSGGTQTCMGYLCELCSLCYGEADPDNHLLNTNKDGICTEDFLCSECENMIRAATEHTPGEAVRENEVTATFEKEGSYDEVVYCAVDACQEEISRTEQVIPMLTTEEIPETECPKDKTCILSGFADIKLDDWYHDGIHFCVEEGLMNGMSDTTFAPNDPTTRAQLVTMLYRLEGEPSIEGMTEPFADVAEGEWYYAPIVWAYNNKVVNGMSATAFEPNTDVSREQVATILHRYLESPEGTGKLDTYPDVADVSDYAKDALVWAVGEGLINGVAQADGTSLLDPSGNATRAQIATILMRYLTA